ncbi:MAG: hypothetical protein AUJ20_04735 [Comamonadaceae bacterium CG1_02_60_18]|nr:MAG: hypothetical protein AUJ20_04735 [Comamonadaceae bacterium CG1_02_60_18]
MPQINHDLDWCQGGSRRFQRGNQLRQLPQRRKCYGEICKTRSNGRQLHSLPQGGLSELVASQVARQRHGDNGLRQLPQRSICNGQVG